jgi:N-methylhydantoinase A/oxoprolinase/acetone carboxylase beta subunit
VRLPRVAASGGTLTVEKREVRFGGKALTAGLYNRVQIRPGLTLRGPAVVAEYSATTVIPSGMRGRVDRVGNLIVSVARQQKAVH